MVESSEVFLRGKRGLLKISRVYIDVKALIQRVLLNEVVCQLETEGLHGVVFAEHSVFDLVCWISRAYRGKSSQLWRFF